MTREEAKNELVLWRNRNSDNGYYYKFVEALTMAIKALEEQPCEDCISRQAAIDAIWDGINMDIYTREVKECLEALPSVTPQPKTGKWINGDHICPCCGKNKFKDLDADIWANWQPKYCPNCGAKMIKLQKSEE